MAFNWQQSDWPHFRYKLDKIEDLLFEFVQRTGRISGILEGLPEDAKIETLIETMVAEAIKTSEIEGEYLNQKDVASSIRKNLGLNTELVSVRDKKAEGIAELMVDVRNTFNEKFTENKLFDWNRMILGGTTGVKSGKYRIHEDPMQVVSGPLGKEKIHFEAPPSSAVPFEMKRFIQWFNESAPGESKEIKKPVIRAAIAHLYFESIHPFEDGNGRVGRAISEKALSQEVKRPVFLSLSKAIELKKNDYHSALEKGQRSNEITSWISYFIQTVLEAQKLAEAQIDFTLKKSKFFYQFENKLNDRQKKVIARMFDEGPDGFEGGMNARKYMAITKTSKATATRDLQDLVALNVLIAAGGGRSTRYEIRLL